MHYFAILPLDEVWKMPGELAQKMTEFIFEYEREHQTSAQVSVYYKWLDSLSEEELETLNRIEYVII